MHHIAVLAMAGVVAQHIAIGNPSSFIILAVVCGCLVPSSIKGTGGLLCRWTWEEQIPSSGTVVSSPIRRQGGLGLDGTRPTDSLISHMMLVRLHQPSLQRLHVALKTS